MLQQLMFEMPKERKEIRTVILLDQDDLNALAAGMEYVGEKNKSAYIRRLIHDKRIEAQRISRK